MEPLDVDTPHGPARVHLQEPAGAGPRPMLVLGHGAGGSVGATDLQATAATALELGLAVALVEQPYRVAGRRSPAPAHQLDAAWTAVVDALRVRARGELALIAGGRSSGARVACRTAAATGARGVLCLAFPLQPPRRPSGTEPPTRQPELDGVEVPVLIVQGERDPFGMPPRAPAREVVAIAGTHSLKAKGPVAGAVRPWLAELAAQLRSGG
jgi:predicted alpha/beta-hydrolase family hydrolase